MNASRPDPYLRLFADAGWGLGVAALLFQLVTVALPAGEGRDWAYYLAAGKWAGIWIACTAWGRFAGRSLPQGLKLAVAAYGAAAVSVAFFPAVASKIGLWVWPLAAAVGFTVARRVKENRVLAGVAAAWFVALALAMAGTLLMRATWFGLVSNGSMATYAMPYVLSIALVGPLAYAALTREYRDRRVVSRLPGWAVLWLHIIAAYLLTVPLFRTYGLNFPVSLHHWKAFVEPAASVREGGWLLWDTPSQYGFLQTLLVAALPVKDVWQAFYLLNAGLLTVSGVMLFWALFARRRTLAGWCVSLLIALSCTAQLLPFIDSRMMPSTGAVRFLFVYLMAGYVFWLARHKTLTPRSAGGGHLLWILGALWSFESALFVSIIWFPALLCVAAAEGAQEGLGVKGMARRALRRFGELLLAAAVNAAGISFIYYIGIGHLPDWSLYTVYATSYTGGFNSYPIERIGIVGCWLMVFFLIAALAKEYVARAELTAQNWLNLAALLACLTGIWAMVSAFIPISDDVHLVGTLPALVFLAALVALLLPQMNLPQVLEAAYSKALTCLYVVIALGTLNCFKPGLYDNAAAPVYGDIASLLPSPPDFMQKLVDKAGVEKGARVLTLAQPFSLEEGAYFYDGRFRPFVLPNTEVAYEKPLSPEVMARVAHRRAERMEKGAAFIIERQDNPLSDYPWIAQGLEGAYAETGSVAFLQEYRIRRFERR